MALALVKPDLAVTGGDCELLRGGGTRWMVAPSTGVWKIALRGALGRVGQPGCQEREFDNTVKKIITVGLLCTSLCV